MADITSTIQPINLSSNKVIFWEQLNNGNIRGVARKVSHFKRITVFFLGDLATAGITIEGAGNDDGADTIPNNDQFKTLLDKNNDPLSFTSLPDNPRSITTIPNWIRPKYDKMGGTPDIDIILVCMDAKR